MLKNLDKSSTQGLQAGDRVHNAIQEIVAAVQSVDTNTKINAQKPIPIVSNTNITSAQNVLLPRVKKLLRIKTVGNTLQNKSAPTHGVISEIKYNRNMKQCSTNFKSQAAHHINYTYQYAK